MQMGSNQNHKPSFFKVMIGDFTKRLRIPPDFIKNFDGMVPVKAILRSPSGRFWSIKVKKIEESMFFRKGWSNFVEDHSLEFGDFLVMKYIGNSQFDVKVYGRNACEKELPPSCKNINIPIHLKKKNIKIPILQKKKERTQKIEGEFSMFETKVDHKYDEGNFGRDSVGSDKGICRSRGTTVKKERREALEAAFSSKVERPYFNITWLQRKKYGLEIPKQFIRNVGEELSDVVVLKDLGDKVWYIGLRKVDGRVWFQDGLQEFAEYHSTSDQHVLRFRYDGNSQFYVYLFNFSSPEMKHLDDSRHLEEPNLDAPPYQTHIDFRKEEVIGGNAGQQTNRKRGRPPLQRHSVQHSGKSNEGERNKLAYEIYSGCKTGRIRTTSPSGKPYKKKRTRYQGKNNEISDSDEQGEQRAQPFKSKVTSTHSRNPSNGHAKLVLRETSPNKTKEDNEIKSSNVDRAHPSAHYGVQVNAEVREVVVKEEEEEIPESPVARRGSYSWAFRTEGNERANEVANAFKSKYPFFTVVMRESYLSKGYLHIPNSFAKKYLHKSMKTITLRDPDKKAWSVGYCVRGAAKQLSSGWTQFVREFGLKEGDVCVFELIKKNTAMLRVSAFPK